MSERRTVKVRARVLITCVVDWDAKHEELEVVRAGVDGLPGPVDVDSDNPSLIALVAAIVAELRAEDIAYADYEDREA